MGNLVTRRDPRTPIQHRHGCAACGGDGWLPSLPEGRSECGSCNGTGYIVHSHGGDLGFTIGKQVIPDHFADSDRHTHGTLSAAGRGGPSNESGPAEAM